MNADGKQGPLWQSFLFSENAPLGVNEVRAAQWLEPFYFLLFVPASESSHAAVSSSSRGAGVGLEREKANPTLNFRVHGANIRKGTRHGLKKNQQPTSSVSLNF